MKFGQVRRALVWVGAAALVTGTTGVLGAPGALATATADAPTVGDTTASEVTATTAKLAATVNPGGGATSVAVTCTGGSYRWSASGFAASRSNRTATATLTELTPETAYNCALT